MLNALGNNIEAIKCYEQAILIDPKFVNALNGKGIALNALGQNETAI